MVVIGGHVSAAGGLQKAIERGVERKFKALQLFASPPQGYRPVTYTKDEGIVFKEACVSVGVTSVFFHAIYLLNLASEKSSLLHASKQSLIGYMNFGHYAGTVGTIFHVGSVKSLTFIVYKNQIIQAMKEILESTPEDQFLIMENAAGGGGRVGVTLDELCALHDGVGSNRLKICIDTQHLWGSGINVADHEAFASWLTEFDKRIGIDHLVCMHVNDSKVAFASMKDRHENIGEGTIGLEGLKSALTQPLLQGKPLIMEVPGFDGQGPDGKNRQVLEEILK